MRNRRLELIRTHLKQSFTLRECHVDHRTEPFYTGNKLTNEHFVDYTEVTDLLLEITLNQPQKLNSLNKSMIFSLLNNTIQWIPKNIQLPPEWMTKISAYSVKTKSNPKVVLLTGSGKAFCAGGDITSLYQNSKKPGGVYENQEFFNMEFVLDFIFTRVSPLVISFWNGAVMGGGVGISINNPIRIATEDAVFAMPELAIGLFPDVGSTWFLPRIFNNNLSIGLYVGLTGHRIKGKDLVKCGVATHYMPKTSYNKLKETLANNLKNTSSVQQIKDLVDTLSELKYESKNFFFENQQFIDNVFKLDSLDNIIRRLKDQEENGSEKNKKLSKAILDGFGRFSPTSTAVFFHQMKIGEKLKSIEEGYQIECQLANIFSENKDFYEGIRALLIDKTNKPSWEYKSIYDIDMEKLIVKYFETKKVEHPKTFCFTKYI